MTMTMTGAIRPAQEPAQEPAEEPAQEPAKELAWGRRYLMVPPDHFRVAYAINPFMDRADQPDRGAARAQWDDLVAAIRAAGGEVDVIAQRPDSPDMVYAMNLGLVVDGHAVLSHMRFPQRRRETQTRQQWLPSCGLATSYV